MHLRRLTAALTTLTAVALCGCHSPACDAGLSRVRQAIASANAAPQDLSAQQAAMREWNGLTQSHQCYGRGDIDTMMATGQELQPIAARTTMACMQRHQITTEAGDCATESAAAGGGEDTAGEPEPQESSNTEGQRQSSDACVNNCRDSRITCLSNCHGQEACNSCENADDACEAACGHH